MPIVIHEMDIQPASAAQPTATRSAGEGDMAASEREKALQIERVLRSDHERHLRLRDY